MAMKHTTLPLAREGVEGEEEKEEHHTTKCPRPCLRRPDTVRSKVHVLSGHLGNDIDDLRLGVNGSKDAPTPASLAIDLSRALVRCFG